MGDFKLEDLEKFVMDTLDHVFLNSRLGQKEKVVGAKAIIKYRFEVYRGCEQGEK